MRTAWSTSHGGAPRARERARGQPRRDRHVADAELARRRRRASRRAGRSAATPRSRARDRAAPRRRTRRRRAGRPSRSARGRAARRAAAARRARQVEQVLLEERRPQEGEAHPGLARCAARCASARRAVGGDAVRAERRGAAGDLDDVLDARRGGGVDRGRLEQVLVGAVWRDQEAAASTPSSAARTRRGVASGRRRTQRAAAASARAGSADERAGLDRAGRRAPRAT